MKNLKKLNRRDLSTIKGSAGDECSTDLDCAPAGCAACTDFKGRKVCLYFYKPLECPGNPS
ncbi:hypothetical protein QE422_001204 [Chryseobacterium sp. SORGH_AS 447]|nr:hypothetical protein [Chryseobacterium sp. SORGH_AS_0447]